MTVRTWDSPEDAYKYILELEAENRDLKMSDVLTREDYQILDAADNESDGEVARILNENGCANLTVCPECFVDDFTHVEGCSLAYNSDQ